MKLIMQCYIIMSTYTLKYFYDVPHTPPETRYSSFECEFVFIHKNLFKTRRNNNEKPNLAM